MLCLGSSFYQNLHSGNNHGVFMELCLLENQKRNKIKCFLYIFSNFLQIIISNYDICIFRNNENITINYVLTFVCVCNACLVSKKFISLCLLLTVLNSLIVKSTKDVLVIILCRFVYS